jgi:uncharacterized protein YjaG (DUF416 family)
MKSTTSNTSIRTLSTLDITSSSTHALAEILSDLEANLKKCRDTLEKAVQKCLTTEAELNMLARSPLHKKAANRSLDENAKVFKEWYKFGKHTWLQAGTWIPFHSHYKNPFMTAILILYIGGDMNEFRFAVGETIRFNIYEVIKVQRRKERRVLRMEELYEKEKDLAAAIVQVRQAIKKREVDRVLALRKSLDGRKVEGTAVVDPSGRVRRW